MQRRTELLSVQRRNISDAPLATVPATREYSRSRADLDDTDSEDEDYNPEDDEVEMSEEHLDNLSEREDDEIRDKETRPNDRANWKVHVIVMLPFSKELRPIGQTGGLLSSVLGSMACDFTFFPISVRSWKQMTTYKEHEFNHQIKEIMHGRHFSRGEMWTITHKIKDGSYIHDDAQAIGEAINDIENRDESTKELSQNDSLAQVFDMEHPRRVHGIGHGPCPTKLFGSASQPCLGYGVQIEEYQKEIVELGAEAAEEKKKRHAMENILRFLIQR
ncbi:hypothetical protein PIB30_065544 [Stylosanthes scabra]|uniref:Uncharacterized protein n=1 Tax=Stylosanthes scabra TaxID=79078 RepID=A0ABU6ULK5_9FABA|nr:hypothetical protein [Stylosanthes scabra]